MASAFTTTPVTYLDVAKRMAPDQGIDDIVEILSLFSPLVKDAHTIESNQEMSHKLTRRTSLPSGTWRGFNEGVLATKSETSQVVEDIGNLEEYALVDKDLADLNGNTAEFMLSESVAHLQSMAQEVESKAWYGDGTTANSFQGFTPRFNALSGGNSGQVVDAEGSGNNNHSIWLVTWGALTTAMLYPKGSTAGIQMTDQGQQTTHATPDLTTNKAGQFEAYQVHFKWRPGLMVRDPRYVVRIANISNGVTESLVPLLIEAQHKLFSQGVGTPMLYMNRTVATALDKEAQAQGNVNLVHREYGGEYVLHFRNMPIRETDGLLDGTEQTVS
jgi:hypothetical protein